MLRVGQTYIFIPREFYLYRASDLFIGTVSPDIATDYPGNQGWVSLRNIIFLEDATDGGWWGASRWKELLARGLDEKASYIHFPDGVISYKMAFLWPHPLPVKKDTDAPAHPPAA